MTNPKKNQELVDYHGTSIIKSNAEVLIELEKLVGKRNNYSIIDHKITGLDIKGQFDNNLFRTDKLPENIGNLSQLTRLNIRHQNITALPSSFIKLIKLVRLSISFTKIEFIDLPFQNFTKLEILNLQCNKLTEVPKNIEKIPKLKELRMGENPIQIVPKRLGKLTSLEEISIQFCNISTLPKTFKNLLNLKKLYIFKNKIETIPDFISKLPHLQNLSLFGNPLRSLSNIPKNLLTKFIEKNRGDPSDLYLSLKGSTLFKNNDIDNLFLYYQKSPHQLAQQYAKNPGSLTAEEKERLAWEGGVQEQQMLKSKIPLATKDPIISQISKKIEDKKKSRNLCTQFQNISILKSHAEIIRKLEEKLCKSFSLQAGITNSIKISHGQITQLQLTALPIPEDLGILTSLAVLSISNYTSKYAKSINMKIPQSIVKLTQLKELYLEYLPESEIQKISFEKFPKLQSLVIKDCDLTEFPPIIQYLKKIKKLCIIEDELNSEISIVPKWLGNLTNLEILDLTGCKIEKLPESFSKLNKLRSLDISYTQIQTLTKLPPLIQSFKMLNTPLRSFSNIPKHLFEQVIYDMLKNGEGGWLDSKGSDLFHNFHHGNLVELFDYYKKPVYQLAQQYADSPKSLTEDERRRLGWEAGHREREQLELNLPPDDPILAEINKRLSVLLKNGLKIMK